MLEKKMNSGVRVVLEWGMVLVQSPSKTLQFVPHYLSLRALKLMGANGDERRRRKYKNLAQGPLVD